MANLFEDLLMSISSEGRSNIGSPDSSASSYKAGNTISRVDIAEDGSEEEIETLEEMREETTSTLERFRKDFTGKGGGKEDFTEMTSNVFDYLKGVRDDLGVSKYGPAAIKWMRDTIKQLNTVEDISVEEKFIRDEKRIRSRTTFKRAGQMFMFNYQPMNRAKLKYYDTFPLVFILELNNDGFTGINLHYLEPTLRERLFLYLIKFSSGSLENEDTRLILRYKYMMNQPFIRRYLKPCIKRYFYRRMDSFILKIPPEDWYIATFLPLSRFKKRNFQAVWKETRLEVFKRGINNKRKEDNI